MVFVEATNPHKQENYTLIIHIFNKKTGFILSSSLTPSIPFGIIFHMENQEKILQIGLSLFSERGYDAVGIQEIVDSAGITKPTLYHYYGSKEGLLESILSHYFYFLLDDLQKNAQYQGDVKTNLENIARIYFHFSTTHTKYYRFLLACWFAPPESAAFKAVQRYVQDQQSFLEDIFQQASNDHGNMRGRHKRYASSFLGLINTYIALAYNNFLELDETNVGDLVHQFMHGIFS